MRHKNGTFGGQHGRTHPAEKMYPVEARPSKSYDIHYMFENYRWRWMQVDATETTKRRRQDAKQRHKKKQRAFHRAFCRDAYRRYR